MQLTWLPDVPSTQDAVASAARAGAAPHAIATTHQTGGRGRRGRVWVCPPDAGVAVSVLVHPPPGGRSTLLPLLAGVAVTDALVETGARDVVLKWPNDVLAHGQKLAGLLAERVETGDVVLGMGVNLRAGRLPEGAVALDALVPGREVDAVDLVQRVLARVEDRFGEWQHRPDLTLAAYRERCSTLGRDVRVLLPGGQVLDGRAGGLDADGRLLLRDASGEQRAISAGDVVHVRPDS